MTEANPSASTSEPAASESVATDPQPSLPITAEPAPRSGRRLLERAGQAIDSVAFTRPRYWLAGFLILIGVVLALSAMRVGSVPISLNVQAELVELTVAEAAETSDLRLRDVAWTGRVNLPQPDKTVRVLNYVSVSRPKPGRNTDDVVQVYGLALVPSDRVVVKLTTGGRVSVTFVGGGRRLKMLVPAGMEVRDDAGVAIPTVKGTAPGIVELDAVGSGSLTGTAAGGATRWLESLAIRTLGFWRADAPATPGPERRVSTILQGTLSIEGGTGSRLDLGEAAPLSIGEVQGTLFALTLADRVSVHFAGEARDLRSGYGNPARSLMPTRLEDLSNRPATKAILALLAIFAASVLTLKGRQRP